MVFGKNYDWVTGTGRINTNLRGLAKSSLPLGGNNILKWTSKYGSTTFNQYGKEFPNGGMNEKGLVVELMWLNESEYSKPDNRPGLTVLQWIQYQLDNCATVAEVIATDKIIRVISNGAPQHYLVADSRGDVATIEFLDGKINVHQGDKLPYPVLTNNTYQSSLQAVNKHNDDNSLDRFSTACTMVQNCKKANINKPLVDYSFDILNKVAQPHFTKWSIVYDISNRKIYFKSSELLQVKSFSLTDFEYACPAKPMSFNMSDDNKGDIGKKFTVFSNEENKSMLHKAFDESSNSISVSKDLQNAVGEFAAKIKCGQG